MIERESIGECLRSSQILNAIPSPNLSALRNSAYLSVLHHVVLCCHQTTPMDHTVLKQSSGPTSSDSLQVWFEKAESSDVAQSIPQCSLFFDLMLLCHQGFGNAYVPS